jgi:hypothetical protein
MSDASISCRVREVIDYDVLLHVLDLCLLKTSSGMTRGLGYDNEAADGRVFHPAACLLSGHDSRGELGLRPKISSCANSS